MVRQKLVLVVVSAVCFAVFAVVTVKGMAARERRWFEASRALLDAGAQLVTSELGTFGRDLPETADHIALDPDLAQQLHALSVQLVSVAAMPKPGERTKTAVLAQTAKVNDRLSTLRADLQVDTVALLDEQGLVLLSDSPLFAVGNRVRLPVAALTAGADGRQPATAQPPAAEAQPAAPDSPSPTTEDAQTETVRSAITGGPSLGAVAVDGTIVHLGAAPIMLKNKLAGVVVVERRLKSLPKPTGVDPVLTLDGQVRLGQAPQGATVDSTASGAAFLVAPREARSIIPNIGAVGIAPLFVPKGSVGVWARRFEVPRVPGAVGYVYTDLTPAYAELGGFQLMTVFLAAAVFLIHALLIAANGHGMARGIAQISDFLGKQQQGMGDGSRLTERSLPSSLHRLARLVNMLIERGGTTPSARNTSLDDVIAHHTPSAAVPDAADLDFASFTNAPASPAATNAPASTAAATAVPSPTPAPSKPLIPASAVPGASAPAFAPVPTPVVAPTLRPSATNSVAAAFAASAQSRAAAAAPVPMDKSAAEILATVEAMAAPADEVGGPEATFHPEASIAEPMPNTNGALELIAEVEPEPEPVDDAARDAHYREVFQRFVEVRTECGENTDELTYERFLVKLGQSRDAVMSKHVCSDVRFAVYVKNGKAALKATPVK